jgi:hypothetical protein
MENKIVENMRRNLINCHLSILAFNKLIKNMTELYFRNENEEKSMSVFSIHNSN